MNYERLLKFNIQLLQCHFLAMNKNPTFWRGCLEVLLVLDAWHQYNTIEVPYLCNPNENV